MNDVTRSREELFFQEGTRTYLQAIRAVGEFERIVQDTARKALFDRWPSLSDRLVAKEQSRKLYDTVVEYSKPNLDDGFTQIGVNFNLPRGGTFYVLLILEGNNRQSVWVGIDTWTAASREKLMIIISKSDFLREKGFVNEWRNEIGITKALDVVSTESTLLTMQRLLDVWIECWDKFDGVFRIT